MALPVTLDQAKAHVRFDDSEDDADLSLKLMSAQSSVLAYLKVASTEALSIGSPPLYPPGAEGAITAATLLLVGYLYRQRDEDVNHEWEQGFLPRPVTALLYPFRDPSCA